MLLSCACSLALFTVYRLKIVTVPCIMMFYTNSPFTMGDWDVQGRPSAGVLRGHKRGDVFKDVLKDVVTACGGKTK
ncbi:hypothetical protein KC19_1G032900 [Ceratodon purpureus]|uniref:Uncharacterized protein n=1 Tax=Ceratodon purpureus TaxID=3225 RepID=A0A8T0J4B0_CERPU|nr:hypothetical protein KC19_1G032900 [Ceratodon purpureus]